MLQVARKSVSGCPCWQQLGRVASVRGGWARNGDELGAAARHSLDEGLTPRRRDTTSGLGWAGAWAGKSGRGTALRLVIGFAGLITRSLAPRHFGASF